ncbi:MAG: protein TolR [Alphaproteobacteria bacterium]|nr:protein TolR [Alphaproteobacteria bacterium]
MAGGVQRIGMSGRAPKSRYRPMSEINVTPFVDVMLVLLIVFMVTAPLLTVGVSVNLPTSNAKSLGQDEKPLAVTMNAEGAVFLQDEEMRPAVLGQRLRAIAEVSPDTRVYVRADQSLSYGQVMQVMGIVNAAGFNKVALVTEPVKRLPSATPGGG